MNKLDMESKNMVNDNIEYIKEKFPNVVVETSKGYEIDFNALKQELSNVIVDESKEKYQLTWPGKKEAILTANTTSKNTLRPLREKSVNFDTTENIYIEGDNLETLKILQESYLNKIKCIYIDPPYNTGSDFIYNDNFNKSANDELEKSGQVDLEGNKLITNNQSNGRFHSDWLSMMYSRLKLSRYLLREDGVIFISIGDDELANIIKICDELFGEKNYLGVLTRISKKGSSMGKFFSPSNDYVICYCKNIDKNNGFVFPQTEEYIKQFKYEDSYGKYKTSGLYQSSLDPLRGCINQRYYIECPDGELVIPPGNVVPIEKSDGKKIAPMSKEDKVWRWSLNSYLENKRNLVFTKTNSSPLINSDNNSAHWNVYTKQYLSPEGDSKVVPGTIIENCLNSDASKELKNLDIDFSFPKPSELIYYLMKISNVKKEDYVLDFFAGSGTTAHSVLRLNTEDNGNRKYILIQISEELNKSCKNYSEKCRNICDLGEERIRRAGKKIKEETNADIDYGFRVYKIDSSNKKDVYYKPSELQQSQLNLFETNVKEDRTTDDLLTQVILDLGLTLDLPIGEKKILNNNVYYVADNSLIACFDDKIDINIIDTICESKPLKVVFKDSSFKYDNDKINLQEKFKKISPDTEINIL